MADHTPNTLRERAALLRADTMAGLASIAAVLDAHADTWEEHAKRMAALEAVRGAVLKPERAEELAMGMEETGGLYKITADAPALWAYAKAMRAALADTEETAHG